LRYGVPRGRRATARRRKSRIEDAFFHEVTKKTKVTKTLLEKTVFRDALTSYYEEDEELFWKCLFVCFVSLRVFVKM
jgi:hypothetical protein